MSKDSRSAELSSLVVRAADHGIPAAERLDAFSQVVRRCQDMVYGCALAILGDFHLAEDAAQEAFLIAFGKLSDLREPEAFPGWLRQIVTNHCRAEIRRRPNSPVSLEVVPEPVSSTRQPAEGIEDGDMAKKVLNALRALPESQRMVAALYYVNGYSQDDIAQFLEVPTSTVKGRLHRCRRRLKKEAVGQLAKAMRSFPLPNGFSELVIRKAASASDLAKARRFLRYRSQYYSDDFASPTSAAEAGIFVIGSKEDVTAAGYFNEVPLLIGNTVVTAARANDVAKEGWGAPDPAFVLSYEAIFELARQKKISLLVVHGSQYDHPFVGFVPSFYYPVVTLPCERALAIRTPAVIEVADAVQKKAAKQEWRADPYAPKMHPPMMPGEVRVVRDQGDVVGYVRLYGHLRRPDAKAMAKKRLDYTLVTDVTVKTRAAALAVIRLAAEVTKRTGRDTVCMMQSHMSLVGQTMISLGGAYLLRRGCNDVRLGAQMVAIVDLVTLTGKLEREFYGRFASSAARDVEAAFSLELEGQTVGFQAEDGQMRIVHEPQPIHRRLPRWVITRLYMGYYSGEEALSIGPLRWDRSDGIVPDDLELDNCPLTLPKPEAELFAALFPKLWPVSWPDMDVWAWILGEEHPQYYFDSEIKLSDEVKQRIGTFCFPWLDM